MSKITEIEMMGEVIETLLIIRTIESVIKSYKKNSSINKANTLINVEQNNIRIEVITKMRVWIEI